MSAYVVARVTLSDPSWVEEYVPNVQALVESHGGKYLVRTTEIEVVEQSGDPPSLVAVLEFPSKEEAKAFYSSAEYQPWLEARKAGADSELLLVEGL